MSTTNIHLLQFKMQSNLQKRGLGMHMHMSELMPKKHRLKFLKLHSPFCPGGATRMTRGGIRLVHGLTKSTLITYYSGMKKDPKYAFLHAIFLICLSCSLQNLSVWPKTHPFLPILHVFAPLNDVRTYSAWSWKTTLITWIFGRAWYPPWHSSAPPRAFCLFLVKKDLTNLPSWVLWSLLLLTKPSDVLQNCSFLHKERTI